jgi:hypothetical protein
MKRLRFAIISLAVAAACFAQEKQSGHSLAFAGIVLDVGCYVNYDNAGNAQATCPKRASQVGEPLAVLTDGGQLVLTTNGDRQSRNINKLRQLIGKRVKVTGDPTERKMWSDVYMRDRTMIVRSVEPAP